MATHSNEIWVQVGDEKRQLEGAQLADYLATCEQINAKQDADKLAADQAAAAKSNAEAKLVALGLTLDDLAALGL